MIIEVNHHGELAVISVGCVPDAHTGYAVLAMGEHLSKYLARKRLYSAIPVHITYDMPVSWRNNIYN